MLPTSQSELALPSTESMVAESSWFHLTLIRAHYRAHFSDSKYPTTTKQEILSEKRESGMALKKSVSLRQKAVMLTR